MEIEALKKSWENLDKKMKTTAVFNQKLVESIISSKVMTTVDKIKRMNAFFYLVLTIEFLFLIALFLGNPFDFQYSIQFIPYVLILFSVVIAFVNLIQISKAIRELSPGSTIDHYVKGIVSAYDRNTKFEKWFGVLFLTFGLLVPLSFVPQKLERMSLNGALLDTGIMIAITLILYIVAFKFGAFKNPYKGKLEKDLIEWNELKTLANKFDS